MMHKKNKNVKLLLAGRMVSQFGFVLYLTALPLHMLKISGSLATVGLLLSVSSVPAIAITPFLGVWIEHVNRKCFMIACDVISGLLYALMFFCYQAKVLTPIVLTIAVTVINLIYSVFDIASTMMFSELAEADLLEKYNSVKSIIENGIAIIGPALATVLYGRFGFYIIVLIASISYSASAIQECFIIYQKRDQQGINKRNYWKELRDGVSYVINKKTILTICVLSMSLNFFLGNIEEVINPGILIQKHQISEELFGFTSSAWILGALIGSTFVLRNKRFHLKENMHRFLFIYSIIMIVVGLLSTLMLNQTYGYFVVFLVCQLLCSVLITCVNVPLWSYLQTNVELDYQGRFFSIQSFLTNILTPLGILYTGYLADWFGADWAYVINGLCIIMVVLICKPRLSFLIQQG